jgi:hypothetical protein
MQNRPMLSPKCDGGPYERGDLLAAWRSGGEQRGARVAPLRDAVRQQPSEIVPRYLAPRNSNSYCWSMRHPPVEAAGTL